MSKKMERERQGLLPGREMRVKEETLSNLYKNVLKISH